MSSVFKPLPFYYDLYYIVNYMIILSFLPLRYFVIDTSKFPYKSLFGLNIETCIYVFIFSIVLRKFKSRYNLEQFLSDILPYLKILIILICIMGYPRAVFWYMVPFVLFGYTLQKEPLVSNAISHIENLTSISIESIIEDDFTSTKHLVLLYHPKHYLSYYSRLDFIKLSFKYRSHKLKFYEMNINDNYDIYTKYDIPIPQKLKLPLLGEIEDSNEQLPMVLCFSKGCIEDDGILPCTDPDDQQRYRRLTWPNMIQYFQLEPLLDAQTIRAQHRDDMMARVGRHNNIQDRQRRLNKISNKSNDKDQNNNDTTTTTTTNIECTSDDNVDDETVNATIELPMPDVSSVHTLQKRTIRNRSRKVE